MENFPQPKAGPKMTIKATLILISFLILAGLLLALFATKRSSRVESVQTLETGDIFTRAEKGSTVPNFPKELLLVNDAKVTESYAINYVNNDLNFPVASFDTKAPLTEVIAKYGKYMQDSGWQIVQEAKESQDVPFWYAKRGLEDLNVTFRKDGEITHVSVAYSIYK